MKRAFALAGLCLLGVQAGAQDVLFDFENATLHMPLPIDVSAGGINAHLWATPYYNYSVQWANTMGFTPVGFSGLCIYPNSVFKEDLNASFNMQVTDFSILYAVQELECDSSARMRVTAYQDATFVGTNTTSAVPGGVWPSATLRITTATPFNRVVVHYDAPPPTGGDYGVIFMADNMRVTPVPEPGTLAVLAVGLATLIRSRRRRL